MASSLDSALRLTTNTLFLISGVLSSIASGKKLLEMENSSLTEKICRVADLVFVSLSTVSQGFKFKTDLEIAHLSNSAMASSDPSIESSLEKLYEENRIRSTITAGLAGLSLLTQSTATAASGRSILHLLNSPDFFSRTGLCVDSIESTFRSLFESGNPIWGLFLQSLGMLVYLEKISTDQLAGELTEEEFEQLLRLTQEESFSEEPPKSLIDTSSLDDSMIPEEFEENPIFSKRICCITHAPIRYPVFLKGEEGSKKWYELVALSLWIQHKKTHPLTRVPISLSDIIHDKEAQDEIEAELKRLKAVP